MNDSRNVARQALRTFALAGLVLGAAACASPSGARPAGASGASAGRTGDAAALATAIDAATAPYVASRKSKKYYPAACHTVKLIKPADQVGFASQKDAEAAGFAKDLYSTDCQY